MAVTITGLVGAIRQDWHHAAEVRDWTVTKGDDGRLTLVGTLARPDVYRLTQQPLTFTARNATTAYRWPLLTLQITGASCAGTLGPLERPDHVLSGRQG